MLQIIQKKIIHYIKKNTKYIVWVSWWPDSMFVLYILTQILKFKKIDQKKIKIAIYDHNFRKEAKKEIKFLKWYFKEFDINIEEYKWKDFREAILRNARYNFFKKLWWWKDNTILVLWHNLTDRIETSIINLWRWSWLKWFLNMKIYSEKQKILRPLLDYSKKDIQKICDDNKIPYFLDKTNLDNNISKRNFVRNDIFPKFEEISLDFYKNFNNLYNQIENIIPNINIEDIIEELHKDLDIEVYKIKKDTIEIYIWKYGKFFIRELMDYFEIYDFRKWVIDEIINYISKAKWWWYKIYNNTFLSKKWKNIYIWKSKNTKNINIREFIKNIIN